MDNASDDERRDDRRPANERSAEAVGVSSSASESERAIGTLLDRLRGRIRRYVALEGIAAAIAWLAGLFVLAVGLDYLPILLGLTELPRAVRAVLMVILLGGALFLFVRLTVLRWLVPLPDRSLALLIERYHGDFREALVTTVERPAAEGAAGVEMLARSRSEALALIDRVDLGRIFDRARLTRALVTAGGAVAIVAVLGLASPETLGLGARRLLLLDDAPWPRSTRIEVVGVRVVTDVANPVLSEADPIRPFEDKRLFAAKGSRLVLIVRAATASEQEPELRIPGRCVVTYRTDDGERGFQYMDKVGQPRDGYQYFELAAAPFRSLIDGVRFDVRGDDSRAVGYAIETVDSPTVVAGRVDCVFPSYMVDEATDSWTPRALPLGAGTQVPIGTTASLELDLNKPLRRVWALHATSGERRTPEFVVGQRKVRLELGTISENVAWDFTFEDADGVVAEIPYRAELLAVADRAPQVKARLAGIGDAITPEARLPIGGMVEDDFAVDRIWWDVTIGEGEPIVDPIDGIGPTLDAALDLREKRQAGDETFRMEPDQGQVLTLTVAAADRFDLDGGPNVGQGDLWELEVVSATQLLRRLERKEAGQRQLVEQIHDELTEAHNLLVRIRDEPSDDAGAEPGDASGAEPGDAAAAVPPTDLPADEADLIFAQRVLLQLRKSREELNAVAATFDDIRLQLINNRVDSEERKTRLETEVVLPLRSLIAGRFASTGERIEGLIGAIERRIADPASSDDPQTLLTPSIDEMQLLLVELDDILQKMLKFESYNELLDVVRELIRQQESLLQETEKERKRREFEELIR